MNPAPQDPSKSPDLSQDIDYTEKHDVQNIHAAVARENEEPIDGKEPLNLALLGFFGAALFAGGLYLSLYSGGFRWDAYSIYDGPLKPSGGAAGPAAEVQEASLAEIGDKVYRQNCVACHQGSGLGVAGQYPPLAGSDWVLGSEKRLAAIMLNGVQGPLTVNGVQYNGVMPAWNKNLNDERIAAVMTYIRSAWGNTASEVSPEQVAAAREEFSARTTPWTEPELLAIPADATLPGGGGAAPAEAPAADAPADGAAPQTEAPANAPAQS